MRGLTFILISCINRHNSSVSTFVPTGTTMWMG